MFLSSVNAASPTIDTGSFIANILSIQTGERFNNYVKNSDWILRTGIGERTYTTAVQFDSPFRVPPKVSLALSGQDVEGVHNNRLRLIAENITVDGFDLVYKTWSDTIVYGVWATWTAIGLKP